MENKFRVESLAGEWDVKISARNISDDNCLKEGFGDNRCLKENSAVIESRMKLPGTLDENRIGYKDVGANQWHPEITLGNDSEDFKTDKVIKTRFTRKYIYEGCAEISKKISFVPQENTRVFLEVERARCLRLFIDGKEVLPFKETSISTPYVYEVTGLLSGDNKVTLLSDNSYPGLPHDDIVYSSAVTDETQTNWNGVLGYFQLRQEPENFIESIKVYPHKETLKVFVTVDALKETEAVITLSGGALLQDVKKNVKLVSGKNVVAFESLTCASDIRKWDEYEGNLYEMTAVLVIEDDESDVKKVNFGIRDFGDNGKGRFALNDRVVFIRSEANCAEFPEEGHPPMEVDSWMDILTKYKDYGVNLMRFHSHCPPEAAFTAADRLGIMMQPELSCWNPRNAFETPEANEYYNKELHCILDMLANHPSFVALTLGNELQTSDEGLERMHACILNAKEKDDTRLYAIASNGFYGEKGCDSVSDFYASQKYYAEDIRGCFANMEGYINNQYPDTKTNYDTTLEHIRETYEKPVFSFEVGQYEVLPDFDELELFKGVSIPANYEVIKERVEKKGLMPVWKKYVEATGELSLIGYREEVEAALRTKELSGISLLGLQDFPGQGTALVGMMNSHLEPKPFDFARPERFRSFFRDSLPLVYMDKYTYTNTENLDAKVAIANYSKRKISGVLSFQLQNRRSKEKYYQNNVGYVNCPMGDITEVGEISIPLMKITVASELELVVYVNDTDVINTYPVWVYPDIIPECPHNVYETRRLDDKAREVLEKGGIVYLCPDSTKESIPNSIKSQFTTDFWSVGTFAGQEGAMGQLIDNKHPVFDSFPTDFHTDWNWWPMANQRALILPKQYEAIVTCMDSYAFLRPMAQLMEFRCLNGVVLLSTFGLHNMMQYPETRALQQSIYNYLGSGKANPYQQIDFDELTSMLL